MTRAAGVAILSRMTQERGSPAPRGLGSTGPKKNWREVKLAEPLMVKTRLYLSSVILHISMAIYNMHI